MHILKQYFCFFQIPTLKRNCWILQKFFLFIKIFLEMSVLFSVKTQAPTRVVSYQIPSLHLFQNCFWSFWYKPFIGMRWYHTVILIRISLIIISNEHFFMCLLFTCLWWKVYSQYIFCWSCLFHLTEFCDTSPSINT